MNPFVMYRLEMAKLASRAKNTIVTMLETHSTDLYAYTTPVSVHRNQREKVYFLYHSFILGVHVRTPDSIVLRDW